MVKMVKGKALVPSRSGSTQNMAANITVVVRVRPLNERELGSNSRIVVQVIDENHLVFDPKEDLPPFYYQGVQQPSKNYLKRANKELKYAFDCVCGPQDTNENVFEKATKDMLACLMEGYNCSVFVYGATGAGKTFTMIGSKEYPGITYLTMDHLFRTIGGLQIDREFDIGVSYIEVYNENVFDLLKPSHTPLQLRDFPQYGVTVAGLSIHKIKTARELLDMLESGNQNRTQHPTDANAESSRSHAVFQVYVTMRCKTSNQCRMVKLSMIDLAGSERASATGCVGERFKEGANINRSLLALGNCINKLADGSSYIPYRDSKLTRLLKDSLGGNCKTVMIANVSPSSLSYEDTYNTLKYAARANKIQLSIKKNIIDRDMDTAHCMKTIKELQKRNDDLAKELKEAKEEETKWEKKAKELQAKLSLSTYAAPVIGNKLSRAKHGLWRERIEEMVQAHVAVEGKLLEMMSQQRVLSLRQLLRSRAFEQVADLVLRSSCDALEQIRTEELPRQERASENHIQQKINRNVKIMDTWKKWAESKNQLQTLLDDCLAECPYMEDTVNLVRRESELRFYKASNDLKDKLIDILKEEIRVSTDCMSDAHKLLRNCYLVLKGSNQATPALTAEYTAVINKLKSAKNITWSDKHVKNDPHFKFILDLDLENPTEPLEFNDERKPQENNTTLDVITDSEDITDVETSKPTAKKRKGTPMKGTPIKFKNHETIVINDSLELMDMENLNSAKKMKTESDVGNAENFPAIDPKDLNSTFVLAGNMDLKKCPDKVEPKQVPVKRPLGDHNIPRPINLNGDNKGSRPVPVKPVPPMRRVGAVAPPPRWPAFGSSVPRESALYRRVQASTRKAPVTQNSVGYKAARDRTRAQFTPYMRLEVNRRQ